MEYGIFIRLLIPIPPPGPPPLSQQHQHQFHHHYRGNLLLQGLINHNVTNNNHNYDHNHHNNDKNNLYVLPRLSDQQLLDCDETLDKGCAFCVVRGESFISG
jgi:hypothetical protein